MGSPAFFVMMLGVFVGIAGLFTSQDDILGALGLLIRFTSAVLMIAKFSVRRQPDVAPKDPF